MEGKKELINQMTELSKKIIESNKIQYEKCPFCGCGDGQKISSTSGWNGHLYYVVCTECGAQGPSIKNKEGDNGVEKAKKERKEKKK